MSKRLLVTGGAGFIGSNFVRFILKHRPDWHVVNLDALTYSGNLENLAGLESNDHYQFVKGDINDGPMVIQAMDGCDGVIHFAAESHVDRSILDPGPFLQTNVTGTTTLLNAAKQLQIGRFVHVSTDEVYGSLPLDQTDLRFTEQSPIQPNSPYAASKAASDLMVRAYHETFGLDAVVTRCSNNFGPYQFPEKIIPLFVTNLVEGKKVPLYGDGLNVRDWIHVDDHCEALLAAFEKGTAGAVYNIGGNNERTNLELTHQILELMGQDEHMIESVTDRLGHDRRYAIDPTHTEISLGWTPTRSAWPQALETTVKWYREHPAWWQHIRSGAYRDYYQQQYGNR